MVTPTIRASGCKRMTGSIRVKSVGESNMKKSTGALKRRAVVDGHVEVVEVPSAKTCSDNHVKHILMVSADDWNPC